MSLSDWVLLGCLGLSIFIGWRVGTIKVVGNFGSLVLGYFIARDFSAAFAAKATQSLPVFSPSQGSQEVLPFLSLFIDTSAVANRFLQILAFAIIFIVVSYLIRKIIHLLDGVFKGTVLGVVNSVLGAACALVLFVLAFQIAFYFVLPVFEDSLQIRALLDFIAQSRLVLPWLGDFEHLLTENLSLI